MRSEKKKRLGAKGWRVGSAGEFLGLSTQEQDLIDLRLRLADPPSPSPPTAPRLLGVSATTLNDAQARLSSSEAAA